jgi:hypothetical protein
MEPIAIACETGSLLVEDAHGGLVQLTMRVPTVPDVHLLLTPSGVQELLAAVIAARRIAGGYPWS